MDLQACRKPHVTTESPSFFAHALAAAATLAGGVSLLVFGRFLWAGGFDLVDLQLGRSATLWFDAALCLAFFAQHSGMIRRGFRARLRGVVPEHYYGVFYTLASGAALLVLSACWQRSDAGVVAVDGAARWVMRGLCLAALAGVVWALGSLSNFDAFGARALLSHAKGAPPDPVRLTVRGPYRWVRHPFYLFGLVAIWTCPALSLDRILFNALFTAWIAIGARLEERDLAAAFGDAYRAYQRQVPMLIPWRLPARSAW